jgi:hypothetical protein
MYKIPVFQNAWIYVKNCEVLPFEHLKDRFIHVFPKTLCFNCLTKNFKIGNHKL